MNDNEIYTGEEQPKKKSRIGGYVFLAFFIIMIFAIIITGKMGNITACLICFGLLFFVTGLVAFCTTKPSLRNAPSLIFCLVGAAMVVIPLLKEYTDTELRFPAEAVPYIIISVFLTIGLCFLIIPTINYAHKKNSCTPVMALCKELDMHWSRSRNGGRRRVYAPTWEYYYNGQYYTQKSNVYSNIDVPTQGEEYELLIDPEKPEKFYRASMKSLIFFWVFGGIWTFVSLVMIASMLNG
ncbi:MAG: hypothetical protein IJZ72_00790 [Oscillospiraceae bacterium]|nr:hypothetical protein [Oscillospiraceae bacterium]